MLLSQSLPISLFHFQLKWYENTIIVVEEVMYVLSVNKLHQQENLLPTRLFNQNKCLLYPKDPYNKLSDWFDIDNISK